MNASINYGIELAMLKKLNAGKLITEKEYALIKANIDNKYKRIGNVVG